jgi:lipopolysaccharide export system protein LptA
MVAIVANPTGMRVLKMALAVLTIILLQGSGKNLFAQQKREVFINHADSMRNLKVDGKDIRRLLGNVSIRHEETTITCDSLYDYVGLNKFDAYSNVKVFQETTTLYGDTLNFNGVTKRGKVRGKVVRMVDEETTMVTRFLDFETVNKTVNYYGGAVINTTDSRFSSDRGKYYSNQKRFVAAGNVAYIDPDILLNTDSLEYYTEVELIKFYGPTRIYNEENYLYSERGQHNRDTQESEFHINAFIDNGDQKLYGNSIFYDRNTGVSIIEGNGLVIDTTQRINIYGQHLTYNQKTEFAEVKHEPLAMLVSEQLDTLYLRADRLLGISVKDTVYTDSTLYNQLVGVGDVRFFRQDIQGVCDSMLYHSVDSILYMHKDPILWNSENQLTADNVSIEFRNETIHRMKFTGSSFVTSQEDSIRFNQIKGRDMVGFFTNGKLTRLDVNGNGETVYYGRDKGELVGVNKAESSRLSIGIKDNKVVSIMFRESPVATLFPIDKVELQDVMIKGFAWHTDKRPQSPDDIIPTGLDVNFYLPILSKADRYRAQKRNPAESLDDLAGEKIEEITLDKGLELKKPNLSNDLKRVSIHPH